MFFPHTLRELLADTGVATDRKPVPLAKLGVQFAELAVELFYLGSINTARQSAKGVGLKLTELVQGFPPTDAAG